MDADPADDDNYDEHLEAAEAIAKPDQERKKKKREKRDAGASSEGTSSKSKQNAVCPWDDE